MELTTHQLSRHRELLQQAIESGGGTHDNALYDQAKADLELIERRVAEIRDLLARGKPIILPNAADSVRLGCRVVVRDLKTSERRALIVTGFNETDQTTDRYSYSSPIVQSLMGQPVGGTVIFRPPSGKVVQYEVLEIRVATTIEIGGGSE